MLNSKYKQFIYININNKKKIEKVKPLYCSPSCTECIFNGSTVDANKNMDFLPKNPNQTNNYSENSTFIE